MILTRPRTCSIMVLFAILYLTPVASEEKVYRWVDEHGEVHFSRTLPPEYAHKPHQILNKAGVVIERIDDPLAKPEPVEKVDKKLEPLFTEDEVRIRTDRLLVLRYHSEEDILNAMELQVAQLDYDARIIGKAQNSVMKALTAEVHIVANRQRAGLPAEPKLEKNINSLRRRLLNSERSLAQLTLREDKIRISFARELKRYRFLRGGGRAGSFIDEDAEPGAGSVN